jgi:hypothetical protein
VISMIYLSGEKYDVFDDDKYVVFV